MTLRLFLHKAKMDRKERSLRPDDVLRLFGRGSVCLPTRPTRHMNSLDDCLISDRSQTHTGSYIQTHEGRQVCLSDFSSHLLIMLKYSVSSLPTFHLESPSHPGFLCRPPLSLVIKTLFCLGLQVSEPWQISTTAQFVHS